MSQYVYLQNMYIYKICIFTKYVYLQNIYLFFIFCLTLKLNLKLKSRVSIHTRHSHYQQCL